MRTLGLVTETNTVASMSAVVQKNIAVAARGYRQATERLAQAVAVNEADEVFIALLEAVNWLDILDGQIDLSGNVDVQAVLFARTRGHHHMASIAYFDEAQDTVVWRPETQLPVPDKPRDWNEKRKPFYVRHLSQQPVLDVFRRLDPILTTALLPPP